MVKTCGARLERRMFLQQALFGTGGDKQGSESRGEQFSQKYGNIFKEELGFITEEEAELFLKTGARPKFLKAQSVLFTLVQAVEKELDKMQSMGVITLLATCKYATPVVPVVKKDKNVRLCGDYKTTVNPKLETDRYPLPRVEEIFAALSGEKIFCKIDLNRAYKQVVLAEPARRLLAINTMKGLFAVNRLPFGVSLEPAISQRIMDTMLKDLKGAARYLDDILVTGRTRNEHLQNLEATLTLLESRGVQLRAKQCTFFQKKLTYLGHKLSADGIYFTVDKIDAIVATREQAATVFFARSRELLRKTFALTGYTGPSSVQTPA